MNLSLWQICWKKLDDDDKTFLIKLYTVLVVETYENVLIKSLLCDPILDILKISIDDKTNLEAIIIKLI